jgi:hypothetical protein
MATYKPAAHIADIRGHVQNAVYSRNRLGGYIKLRKAPLDRRTPDQLTQRQLLFNAVHYWRVDLSDANRLLWNSLGLLTLWYNKAGIAYHPSGFNLFVRMYIFTQASGLISSYVAPDVAAATAPTFTYSTETNGASTNIALTDPGWCAGKVGYVRFTTTDAYAPSIFYPAWPSKVYAWFDIEIIEGNFPFNISGSAPCTVGDHHSIAAQAAYVSGAGYTVTWPQIVVTTAIAS